MNSISGRIPCPSKRRSPNSDRSVSCCFRPEFGDDVNYLLCRDGERTVAHGAGDVDADNLSFEVYKRSAAESGAERLVVIKDSGESVPTFAQISSSGTQGTELAIPLRSRAVE